MLKNRYVNKVQVQVRTVVMMKRLILIL